MVSKYQEIAQDFQDIAALGSIAGILSWDNSVMMPKNGIKRRSKELTLISNIIHNSYKKKDYLALIAELDDSKLDQWQKANIRRIKHILTHQICIPEKLNNEFTENGINCEFTWRTARKANDFNAFLKTFKPVLNNAREVAAIKSQQLATSKYNALIDYYEPGLREEDFKTIFENLAKKLPELIGKVTSTQPQKPDLSNCKFSVSLQKEMVKRFTSLLGLTSDDIRVDESMHPFCTGHRGDVRITTRYSEEDFLTSLFGIIHESGHAIYDLNTPKEYDLDPVGACLGMSIHESQSLFYEMQVATSRDFIKLAHQIIRDEFNITDDNFTSENLYNFLNHVERKYIRVDSDEVTYPLHIIMRYEIEKKLINGEIEADALPDIWEYYLDKFLSLKYQDHNSGCLQDIHWTDGSFGYFPCYSLGAIFASQLKGKFDQENPNFSLTEDNISEYQKFLTKNVHQYGSLKTGPELANDLFGLTFDDNIYMQYLENKYLFKKITE